MRLGHVSFVFRLTNFRCRTVLAAANVTNIPKNILKKNQIRTAVQPAFLAGGVMYKSLITSFDVDIQSF